MRTFLSGILSCALLTVLTACSSAPSTTAKPSTSGPSSGEPEYRLTATIKDLMDAEVDYNADWLWDAVSTETSAQGVIDRRPKTDDDWKEARYHALALLEATNLLQMPGRAVAKPGEKSENPGIEEGPEEIKALMDADRASWVKYTHGLYDATKLMLDAIDKIHADQMLDLGDQLDQACENCHKNRAPSQGPVLLLDSAVVVLILIVISLLEEIAHHVDAAVAGMVEAGQVER